MVERDERGREIVNVAEKYVPRRPEWNIHINTGLRKERWRKMSSRDATMDMAEKLMEDLMNDRDVSPDTRTINALINGYNHLLHECRKLRAERMYFWLCKMRDLKLQPDRHTANTSAR